MKAPRTSRRLQISYRLDIVRFIPPFPPADRVRRVTGVQCTVSALSDVTAASPPEPRASPRDPCGWLWRLHLHPGLPGLRRGKGRCLTSFLRRRSLPDLSADPEVPILSP